jgi:hypothetical protein
VAYGSPEVKRSEFQQPFGNVVEPANS